MHGYDGLDLPCGAMSGHFHKSDGTNPANCHQKYAGLYLSSSSMSSIPLKFKGKSPTIYAPFA
jgi:hypothetical protein